MALKATIFKANLQLADMDRHHYGDYQLTLARHPSETDERMMVRLLAFALHADPRLEFCKGLCADDEPALWRKSLTGEVELWLDVGLPDSERLRKACGLAQQVCVYCYGGRSAELWWQKSAEKLGRFSNLRVFNLPEAASKALTDLTQRSMELHISIQDGLIGIGDAGNHLQIQLQTLR